MGENWSSGFRTRSDINRPVQSQKMSRSLKFQRAGVYRRDFWPQLQNG